ncbi:MAG: hypothetical protein AAF405_08020 [Pseudomonadota bacterium]
MRSSLQNDEGHRPVKIGLFACVLVAVALAALGVRSVAPAIGEGVLAQSLHQSAWAQALSDPMDAAAWPWQNHARRIAQGPQEVNRLGLSAAFSEAASSVAAQDGADGSKAKNDQAIVTAAERNVALGDVALGDVALGDVTSSSVGIGDSITFTANDGATCIYRVTGRPVVDPHLASGHAEGAGGEAALFECNPLDTLIKQATQKAQKSAPLQLPSDSQRKL